VLTGSRLGWTVRCGRPPLILPSCRKLEFGLSALVDSDLAWVNGKSGRQSWRYADAFQRSIISEANYHLPFYGKMFQSRGATAGNVMNFVYDRRPYSLRVSAERNRLTPASVTRDCDEECDDVMFPGWGGSEERWSWRTVGSVIFRHIRVLRKGHIAKRLHKSAVKVIKMIEYNFTSEILLLSLYWIRKTTFEGCSTSHST